MIKRILALSGISIAVTFAQAPAAQPLPDIKIDPNYKAPKTSWGEPDLQGLWPLNHLIAVNLERNRMYGNRLSLTDEEYAKAGGNVKDRKARVAAGAIPDRDTPDRPMRQTSLIIDPPDGRFPALTDLGKKLQADMQSSYKPGKTVFDSIDDFSAWDHCITRGMPVSMEPRNYNNGDSDHAIARVRGDSAPEMAHEGADYSDQRHAAARFQRKGMAGRIARPLGR